MSEKIIVTWWALTDIIDDAARTWRLNQENVFSHAYVAFRTDELVVSFNHKCNGHIFKDKAGLAFCHIFLVLGFK